MNAIAKASVRVELHSRLRTIPAETLAGWSQAIVRHLLDSELWRKAETVMLYTALPSEPDLMPLMDAAKGRRLIFPGLNGDEIIPRHAGSRNDFIPSAWKVSQPDPATCPVIPVGEIDLILSPGLGFSLGGGRLGRGRGHYDRLLSDPTRRAALCGVCFSTQVVRGLPVEAHDVSMDYLATENGILTAEPDSPQPSTHS